MSASLSVQQLAEIAARAEAATPGPWCTDDWEIYTGTEYLPWASTWIGETCRPEDRKGARVDAAFIAAARTDVPVLLAEVERLRAALGTATDEVAERDAEIGRWSARVAELEALPPLYRAVWRGGKAEPTGSYEDAWNTAVAARARGERDAGVVHYGRQRTEYVPAGDGR